MIFPCLLYSQVHPWAKFWPTDYGKSDFQVMALETSEGVSVPLLAVCLVGMVESVLDHGNGGHPL